jgi:CHASE3 domain sensor protein
MNTVLWVLGIHLVELAGIAFYLIVKKNSKLEQIVNTQQQHLEAVTLLIGKMDDSFKQLEGRVWVGEDEDIQAVFNDMKEIQSVLNSLK